MNKKIIFSILLPFIISLGLITINDLCFEYCVSRECPTYISAPTILIVVVINICALIYAVKQINKLLKF